MGAIKNNAAKAGYDLEELFFKRKELELLENLRRRRQLKLVDSNLEPETLEENGKRKDGT